MFGDLGHGLMMTTSAAYMVLNEKKLSESKGEARMVISNEIL
jgi:vacuolar-type H+-ATPase subunit I/STV1